MKRILLVSILLLSIRFPAYLFTDGPSKSLQKQYPWLTADIYYHVELHSGIRKVEKELVLAIINAESEGKRTALSPVGAIGYMQVMPTHLSNKVMMLYQPETNIRIGVWYLAYCSRIAKGDLIETLKNYNAGPASTFYNVPYLKNVINNYMTSKSVDSKPSDLLDINVLIGML